MSPTNDLNAGLNYAFLNDEELQVLKKAESDINNSRTEKVFLIGFPKQMKLKPKVQRIKS